MQHDNLFIFGSVAFMLCLSMALPGENPLALFVIALVVLVMGIFLDWIGYNHGR